MRVFLTKPDVVLQQHIGSVNGVSPLDEKRLWERLLRSNIHIGWRIRFDCKNRHVLKQQSDLFWSFTVYFVFRSGNCRSVTHSNCLPPASGHRRWPSPIDSQPPPKSSRPYGVERSSAPLSRSCWTHCCGTHPLHYTDIHAKS